MQRKLSLISKHNTLVYRRGAGGGKVDNPPAPTPKQVKPAAGKPSDDNGRRLRVGGTSAVQSATKKDEVVSPYEISMGSQKNVAAKLARVNSATTSPLPSRGGGAKGAVRVEPSRGSNYVGERGSSGNSNDNGDTEAGSTMANVVDLAGIKKGIEAFTERVCRLEEDSRIIPGADTEGEAGCEGGPNEGGKMDLMRLVGEHDGCNGDTTDLVERVRLLEAHILRLRFPATVSSTVAPDNSKNCKTDDCDDIGGVAAEAGCLALGTQSAIEDEGNTENEKVASAKFSSADDLQGVIAELLSLLALLLKRAANAEERLRKLIPDAHESTEKKSSGDMVAVDGRHSEKPRVTAWTESIASAGSGEVSSGRKEEREEHFHSLSSHSCGDGGVENGSARNIYTTAKGDAERNSSPSNSLSRELGVELRSVSGSVGPEKVSSSGSPPKDYWVEALDAVGQLVEGDARSIEASVEAFGVRLSMSSSRVEETQGLMPLTPPTQPMAAADDVGLTTAMPATTSPFRSFESTESLEPRAEPRPLPRSVRVSTHPWGAREVLRPIPVSTLPRGFGSYSRASSLGDIGGEADAGPVFCAPTPAKEPQHPFERLPPRRSPSWLHENSGTLNAGVGSGRRTQVSVTSTAMKGVVGHSFADDDYGAQDSAGLPAIGQWYTP